MAEYGRGIDETLVAVPDMSTAQYRAVIPASGDSMKCMVASQAGDAAVGILQNKPQSGEGANVRLLGVSKGQAGGTVETQDVLRASATGHLVAGNSGFCVGTALSDAASGGIFTLLVHPHQGTA